MDIWSQLYVFIIMIEVVFMTMSEGTFPPNDDINVRCPYSDICERNASLKLTDKSQMPCCSSCSCSPDCGLHLNCCYEQMDKYRLVDSKQMVCVNIGNMYKENKYYMIDKCLDGQNGDRSSKQCRTQGENQTKLTTNLEPVSSLETRFIYFNSECAKCNNVHNYTTWDYTFDCGNGFDIANQQLSLQYVTANDICDPVYVEPESEDWSARKCYTFEPSTCGEADQWLRERCSSIYAPYVYEFVGRRIMYINIYCAMCSAHSRFIAVCVNHKKSAKNPLLTTVIRGSVNLKQLLSQLLQEKSAKLPQAVDGECLPHEVMHPNQVNCRYIYCPDGMYRQNDICVYYAVRWAANVYMVQLELKSYPDTKLMTSSLKLLGLKYSKNPKRWIRSSCIVNITALEVFRGVKDDSNKSSTVGMLILRLFDTKIKSSFDPSVFLPLLRSCFREKWMLTIEGIEYAFSAELYKYKRFIQDGIQYRYSLTHAEEVLPKLFELIASGPGNVDKFAHQESISLSKLHFCEQVRLNMSEIEVGYNEIRILSHDLVLGSNWYKIYTPTNTKQLTLGIFEPMYNLTTFAVCLEDFNKQAWQDRQQAQNNFKKMKQDVYLYLTSMLLLLYCM